MPDGMLQTHPLHNAATDTADAVKAAASPLMPPRPTVPAGTKLPARTQQVVYEDEHVILEWSVRTPPTQTIAITFDPILVQPTEPAYAASFLHRAGVDTLCVRKKKEHFYQPLSRERFDAVAGPVLAHYCRRLAYGSSLGAYAALYFCAHGFDMVISSSPRVSAHPRFGSPHWQLRVPFQHERFVPEHPASSGAVVFYDPHDAMDQRLVDEELRPAWPRARFLPVPYAGHPANQFLSEIGFISPFVQAVAAGKPPPILDRRRHKARSFTYRHILAMGCLRHGKPHWAESLCWAALAMKPELTGAKLTLGQALLAQGRLDEAEPPLREFQHAYPQDGDVSLALRTLERQRTGPARPPLLRGLATRLQQHWMQWKTAWQAQLQADRQARSARVALLRPWWRGRLRLAVTYEDVQWCYRLLLGRAPESEIALLAYRRARRFEALAHGFITSEEHRSRLTQDAAALPLALRVQAACVARRLIPLGGLVAELGAGGVFGGPACLRLDRMGRPAEMPQAEAVTGLELALWLTPLRQPDAAAAAVLRTLVLTLRPGGHALVALCADTAVHGAGSGTGPSPAPTATATLWAPTWAAVWPAAGLELMQVYRTGPDAADPLLAWARKPIPSAAKRSGPAAS